MLQEMAVLIHARLTLDGNFGAMERYRGHIEAIEKEMAEVHDIVKGVHKPPMAHELPLKEYEEEELTKALVEIEACFEEMGLHRSAERQEVESAVAFEPLEYGQDIEHIHTQLDDLSTTWKQIRLPAWAGFVLAGVFVAACFVEQGVALFSVSPYHFAFHAGNVWPFVWWPHPPVHWLGREGERHERRSGRGSPFARGNHGRFRCAWLAGLWCGGGGWVRRDVGRSRRAWFTDLRNASHIF